MTQDVPLTIAFLAGIFSFLSPCVLPIVPGFMSYILGKSFSDIQNTSKLNKLKLLPLILLFISGFSLVFIIMGASIDLISDVFFDYKKQLNFMSGLLIIFLGFFFIGIIKFPFLDFERKLEIQKFQNISNKPGVGNLWLQIQRNGFYLKPPRFAHKKFANSFVWSQRGGRKTLKKTSKSNNKTRKL